MTLIFKSSEDIVPSDFAISPVWEFVLQLETVDDTLMRPVMKLPVNDLGNRIIGTEVRFANGSVLWGAMSNVDTQDTDRMREFLSLSIYKGVWYHLARYFDPDSERNGPFGLAKFLGLKVSDIFPIAYDLRSACSGNPNCLAGVIPAKPEIQLDADKRFQLMTED
jgi:hypothetical protein